MYYPGYFEAAKRPHHSEASAAAAAYAVEQKMLAAAAAGFGGAGAGSLSSSTPGLGAGYHGPSSAGSLPCSVPGRTTHLGVYGPNHGAASFLPPTPPVSAPPPMMDPMTAAAVAASPYAALLNFQQNAAFLASYNGSKALGGGGITSVYGSPHNHHQQQQQHHQQQLLPPLPPTPTSAANGLFNGYSHTSGGIYPTPPPPPPNSSQQLPPSSTAPVGFGGHHHPTASPSSYAQHEAALLSDYYRNMAAVAAAAAPPAITASAPPPAPSAVPSSDSFMDSLKQLQVSLEAGKAAQVAANLRQQQQQQQQQPSHSALTNGHSQTPPTTTTTSAAAATAVGAHHSNTVFRPEPTMPRMASQHMNGHSHSHNKFNAHTEHKHKQHPTLVNGNSSHPHPHSHHHHSHHHNNPHHKLTNGHSTVKCSPKMNGERQHPSVKPRLKTEVETSKSFKISTDSGVSNSLPQLVKPTTTTPTPSIIEQPQLPSVISEPKSLVESTPLVEVRMPESNGVVVDIKRSAPLDMDSLPPKKRNKIELKETQDSVNKIMTPVVNGGEEKVEKKKKDEDDCDVQKEKDSSIVVVVSGQPPTEDSCDSHKTSIKRKSNSSAKRRRLKSGLDMIHKKRKNTKGKTTSSSTPKKENQPNSGGAIKKSKLPFNLKFDTKRMMVNKSLGETLLHRCAKNNRLDVVKYCLETQACDVNVRDNAGYTPLHECCISKEGNVQVARLLLEFGADVNANATEGIRPLHDAIENDHIELVRLLLAYGADPYVLPHSGVSPLEMTRSKPMQKFLKGFYSDISTERHTPNTSSISWLFDSSLKDNGFDVFADVPEDYDSDNDDENCSTKNKQTSSQPREKPVIELFYCDTRPLLPFYQITRATPQFYLLKDVLTQLDLTESSALIELAPTAIVRNVTRDEFRRAVLSNLETRHTKIDETELAIVERTSDIDALLGVRSLKL